MNSQNSNAPIIVNPQATGGGRGEGGLRGSLKEARVDPPHPRHLANVTFLPLPSFLVMSNSQP